MKFSNGMVLTIVEVDDNNIAKVWLIGNSGYIFKQPENKVKILDYIDYHNEIRIIDEETFNRIKKEKQLGERLFPYNKEFSDLEDFTI